MSRWKAKIKFREHPAVIERRNRAHMLALISDPVQRARYEKNFPESALTPLPRTRTPPQGADIDAVHGRQPMPLEADVLRAVTDLLAVHPRVIFAVRQNSGQASYEAKSGKYAPVAFYKWIKAPKPVTLPDVWGLLNSGKFFFLEVKRGGWTGPRDDRERKQAAFLALAIEWGALAAFVTDADQVDKVLG